MHLCDFMQSSTTSMHIEHHPNQVILNVSAVSVAAWRSGSVLGP
uniref:Uncharacterized protein n=1 Tax=Wuchereria bancrofti TaxID=6293 RepID=A0AAF5PUV5_WUCBA